MLSNVIDKIFGVDAGTGFVYTITAISTNVHDILKHTSCLWEDVGVVYSYFGYISFEKCGDEQFSKIDFRILHKPKSIKNVSDKAINREKN